MRVGAGTKGISKSKAGAEGISKPGAGAEGISKPGAEADKKITGSATIRTMHSNPK